MAELYVVGAELLRCTIEGKPISKGRPRCACRGGYPKIYTPKETEAAEERIREVVALHWGDRQPYNGPMELSCVFYGAHGSADGDNLMKLVADALGGPPGEPFVFSNDKLIKNWHGYVRKKDQHGARTEIRLNALEAGT